MINEQNLTPELLEKAKATTSAAELLGLAQENGIALTAEQAVAHYTKLHPESGAISDEQLDNVSGGCGGGGDVDAQRYRCRRCGKLLEGKDPVDGHSYCKKCGYHKRKT